jgi:hypothetical protein
MKKVPKALRVWFVVHFVVDFLFGVPLIICPVKFLALFGIESVEMVTARLVGAALLGIGGVSLWTHKQGIESYQSLLKLKILWSLAAILSLVISAIQGAPIAIWGVLVTFLLFSGIWIYFKLKLDKIF